MVIPWKFKSFIFRVVDLWNLQSLLYIAQKFKIKRSRLDVLTLIKNWKIHQDVILKYNIHGTLFEFGAGKHLGQNLFLSKTIEKQIVVDLFNMLDLRLVETHRQMLELNVGLKHMKPILSMDDLSSLGIEYIAPFDVRSTGFSDSSINICVSTNTLEHIPKAEIYEILVELKRILIPNSIISFIIDYSDHYAHTDNTISYLNFLKYDENEWTFYNHSSHFQNRLRHFEYREIFTECGFEVLSEIPIYGMLSIEEIIQNKMQHYDKTWSATSGHFILRNISINNQ